jgi:plasmid stabilization system protein ParE
MESASYHVILMSEALADLQGISRYVRGNSPQNAPILAKRVVEAIDSLGSMPKRFRFVGMTRKRKSPVHAMSVPPYIIYYRIEERQQAVRVLSIRHGAQRQPRRFK